MALFCTYLLTGSKVNQPAAAVFILHNVGRLQVEVVDILSVHILQRCQHLWEHHLAHLLLAKRLARTLHPGIQRFALDEAHHVVGCLVLLEEVAHIHHMLLLQRCQPLCLIIELGAHLVEGRPVLLQAHRHGDTLALVDAPYIELLHRHVLVQLHMLHLVGIAEPARCHIAHHAIFTILQQRAHGQHLPLLHLVHH